MLIIETTNLKDISVEIDGKVYPLAPKTVAIANELHELYRRNEGQPEYKTWLAEMEIILGKKAAGELFHSGSKENIDRMHRIRSGVMRAFETNVHDTEADEMEAGIDQMSKATAALSDIIEQISKLASVNMAANKSAAGAIQAE